MSHYGLVLSVAGLDFLRVWARVRIQAASSQPTLLSILPFEIGGKMDIWRSLGEAKLQIGSTLS